MNKIEPDIWNYETEKCVSEARSGWIGQEKINLRIYMHTCITMGTDIRVVQEPSGGSNSGNKRGPSVISSTIMTKNNK